MLIKEHTCFLDFRRLGYDIYDIKARLFFKAEKEEREWFLSFLKQQEGTNNIFRINNTNDYFVEQRQEHFILEDLAKVRFLNYEQGWEVLHRASHSNDTFL
ncbi:hypothetical protein JXA12_00360 [Candidatus Woesearchaeota archaeon]|nr:hypothetical protein [Candidatus Woesearchaeota archaeon]